MYLYEWTKKDKVWVMNLYLVFCGFQLVFYNAVLSTENWNTSLLI